MASRDVAFYSDGIRLEGFILTPESRPSETPTPAPTMVICSGLFGLKEWVPARWWPQFLNAGFTCIAFDYRGFGTSEGQRGRVDPQEQVRDVINAITFAREQPEVDPAAIGVLGWGLGGGVVVSAAARDERIAAVASVNGPGDVARVTRDGVPYTEWLAVQDRLAVDRVQRATRGVSKRIPFGEITHPGTENNSTAQFDKDLSELGQRPEPEFTMESAEAYYAFRPEQDVPDIAPRPLLLVHGTRNHYMPIDEARRMFALAKEPKTLQEIPDAAHLEWLDRDSPDYEPNVARVVAWFERALCAGGSVVSAAAA